MHGPYCIAMFYALQQIIVEDQHEGEGDDDEGEDEHVGKDEDN